VGSGSVEGKGKKECRRSECDASSQSFNLQRSDSSQTEPAKGWSLTEMCGEVEEAVVHGRRRRAQAHLTSDSFRLLLVPCVRRLGYASRGQGAGVRATRATASASALRLRYASDQPSETVARILRRCATRKRLLLQLFPYAHSSLYGCAQRRLRSTMASPFVDHIILKHKPVYWRCRPYPPVSLD
jgi:hypothetical protein